MNYDFPVAGACVGAGACAASLTRTPADARSITISVREINDIKTNDGTLFKIQKKKKKPLRISLCKHIEYLGVCQQLKRSLSPLDQDFDKLNFVYIFSC